MDIFNRMKERKIQMRILPILFIVANLFSFSIKALGNSYIQAGWETYTPKNSGLLGRGVNTIAFDDQDQAWIGTDDGSGSNKKGGLSIFDGVSWTTHQELSSLPLYFPVNAILFDNNGQVWISNETSKGGEIYIIDRESWSVEVIADVLLSYGGQRSIEVDELGRIWMGTPFDGLKVYDSGNWKTYEVGSASFADNRVRGMAFDNEGLLWIGVVDGYIARLEDGYFRNSIKVTRQRFDSVETLAIDNANRVWAGTDNSGLSMIDGENIQIYSQDNSGLTSNRVRAIEFDEDDRAWIGTGYWNDGLGPSVSNSGVSVFDGENWITYTKANSGLVGNFVNVIVFDDIGRAWIGTSNGLSIANPSDFANMPQALNFLYFQIIPFTWPINIFFAGIWIISRLIGRPLCLSGTRGSGKEQFSVDYLLGGSGGLLVSVLLWIRAFVSSYEETGTALQAIKQIEAFQLFFGSIFAMIFFFVGGFVGRIMGPRFKRRWITFVSGLLAVLGILAIIYTLVL